MDQRLIVGLLAVLLLLTGIVIVVLIMMMGRLTEVMKKSDFAKLKKEEEENEYEEEIMNIAQEGHEQGVILADEAEMISNIFEFGDKDAKDVMQFRNKIVSLDAGMTVGEALHFMVEQTYSRYPVCEDDLDHIIGILNFRDAVQAYFEDPDQKVEDISRKPSYVHENMDINELLTQMKEEKNHLVIVVDEYGQTVGLVAMEDILETIVGDILDEYDVEEKEIIRLPSGDYLASGMLRLDDLEEHLGITFDTEEFETLNGFLINELGHLPEPGEEISVLFKGYRFTTSEQKDKILRQIRIIREPETLKDADQE